MLELVELEAAIGQAQHKPTDFYPAGSKPTPDEGVPQPTETARAANVDRIALRDAARQHGWTSWRRRSRQEARALLKERFDYPNLHVRGGEGGHHGPPARPTCNELYPNDNPPLDLDAIFWSSTVSSGATQNVFSQRPRGVNMSGGAFAVRFREL